MPRARGMTAYVRDGYGAFQQPKFRGGCYEMMVVRFSSVRQNFYVFSLYCNPDLDNSSFHCLLTSMAVGQADDVLASLLFWGDLNEHHHE